MKRKIYFLVSLKEAKRKRDGFCFALFHFEAKKNNKRKWDTLIRRCPPPLGRRRAILFLTIAAVETK